MAMYTSGISPSSRGSCHLMSPSACATVRAWASANSLFLLSGAPSAAPTPKRETVSTPAEMNTSPSPALMAWKAIRVVCSEDEQYRFTVVPGRKS